MAVKLLEIKKESCPATRLIGRKYTGAPNWGEWWENMRYRFPRKAKKDRGFQKRKRFPERIRR